MEQNEVKCPFLGTMVLKAKKTSVLVLIPRLFDRFRSRTVDALLPSTRFLTRVGQSEWDDIKIPGLRWDT